MLKLLFEGYYQMRMATDPDPPDDPRGLSGYTFALPGEPDFDHKLHFQPDEKGACQRVYGLPGAPGPQIGVRVVDAIENGAHRPALKGALVRFVDAEIVERNGVVVRNDLFAIDPLRVRIEDAAGKAILERVDLLSGDPHKPNLPIVEATAAQIQRRQLQGGFTDGSWKVALATGLPSPDDAALLDNRRERQRNLIALRDTIDPQRDPGTYSGLTTRITQLDILKQWWDLSALPGPLPLDRRARQLALLADGWNVDMNGPVLANTIGADEKKLWNLSFWMGGWDGDALCGYIQGQLSIPLR